MKRIGNEVFSKLAIFMLVIGILACQWPAPLMAGECDYVSVDIGSVVPRQSERVPGTWLAKAIEDNPGCAVVAVEYVVEVNEFVKDLRRLFYDKEQKLLVVLTRTKMKVGDDSYLWRIWYDVSPDDFRKGMPYGRADIVTKSSPYRAPKAALLQEYEGPKAAIDWP